MSKKHAITKSKVTAWLQVLTCCEPWSGTWQPQGVAFDRILIIRWFLHVFLFARSLLQFGLHLEICGRFPYHCSRPTQTTWPHQQGSRLQDVAIAIPTSISVAAGVWITIFYIFDPLQQRCCTFHCLLLVHMFKCFPTPKVSKPIHRHEDNLL